MALPPRSTKSPEGAPLFMRNLSLFCALLVFGFVRAPLCVGYSRERNRQLLWGPFGPQATYNLRTAGQDATHLSAAKEALTTICGQQAPFVAVGV